MPLLILSLMVNVFVAGLLPLALLGRGVLMENTYGPDTIARRILACLYATIALASLAALLSIPIFKTTDHMIHIALVLLPFQITYKLATWARIPARHPVISANLVIAALHTLSLSVYWLG